MGSGMMGSGGRVPQRSSAKKMQMAFYSIPARGDAGLQEDLNRFLRSHRVLTMHREFVGQGDNSFWALAVEFLEGPALSGPGPARSSKERIDYKEVLSPPDFALFARLRDWRKTTAEKEGIPVYAILTNEQLAVIAAKRPASPAQLREIEGIGESKAGKYGEAVLEIVAHAGGPGVPGPPERLGEGGTPAASGTGTDGVEAVPPSDENG